MPRKYLRFFANQFEFLILRELKIRKFANRGLIFIKLISSFLIGFQKFKTSGGFEWTTCKNFAAFILKVMEG